MRRTDGKLSDGREIVWYSAVDAVPAPLVDDRDLPPVATSSQLRYDALLDEWVALATQRQDRTYHPPRDQCPLCPSLGDRQTEIPSTDYEVVVFENRFPSFAVDVQTVAEAAGLFAVGPGHGRCEVVCFTSAHDCSFGGLSVTQARLVVDVWADRSAELALVPGVEQVFPFENRGREIGVTLGHPHGQIYAYPYITPRTRRQLASAGRHHATTGRNLFADILAGERDSGARVVIDSRYWTAFVPHAARWPVEVHLYPHRQVPDLPALTDAERDDFTVVYLDVLRRLDRLYDAPLPYIAGWHQAPVRFGRDLAYLHLELFSSRRSPDKLKYLAGSESGMGAFVSDVLPEEVAARLRAEALGGG
ncbi:MAG: galactose-1-phosphate uridylyltransferase [Geodermatophilaceae bacterium]|nr:galactose-1-phosphate uridylyltransferase [Geodermatophilaceae bacterium]